MGKGVLNPARPSFLRVGGVLHCGAHSLDDLAERHGTPPLCLRRRPRPGAVSHPAGGLRPRGRRALARPHRHPAPQPPSPPRRLLREGQPQPRAAPAFRARGRRRRHRQRRRTVLRPARGVSPRPHRFCRRGQDHRRDARRAQVRYPRFPCRERSGAGGARTGGRRAGAGSSRRHPRQPGCAKPHPRVHPHRARRCQVRGASGRGLRAVPARRGARQPARRGSGRAHRLAAPRRRPVPARPRRHARSRRPRPPRAGNRTHLRRPRRRLRNPGRRRPESWMSTRSAAT